MKSVSALSTDPLSPWAWGAPFSRHVDALANSEAPQTLWFRGPQGGFSTRDDWLNH